MLPGYPQPLREYGQGVPAHKIDTAIWWEPNGYTYFFSGDRCTCQKPATRFEPDLKIISASQKWFPKLGGISIRLYLSTSACLCTDTGGTMRRPAAQTATSPSQTADGEGSRTHPKEPSSVMTAVNSDCKLSDLSLYFVEWNSFSSENHNSLKAYTKCGK